MVENTDKILLRTILQYFAGYAIGAAILVSLTAAFNSHLPYEFVETFLIAPIEFLAGPFSSDQEQVVCLMILLLAIAVIVVLGEIQISKRRFPIWCRSRNFIIAAGFVLGLIGACAALKFISLMIKVNGFAIEMM